MEHRWNEIDRGKLKYSEKILSECHFPNTTWTDPGSNPGLRGGRPATNHLSHGTALVGYNIAVSIRTILGISNVKKISNVG
jgi:hypothetical protein